MSSEEAKLTVSEIEKTQIFVDFFQRKSDTERVVALRVTYGTETKSFQATVATNKPKENAAYIRRAFLQLRKEIKQWIRSVDSSIVGGQVVFGESDFNGPIIDDA